jgi:hypothetical protein
MCGVYPSFTLAISRYLCRIWWPETEKERHDQGEEKIEGPSMFGDPADIREGDKVIRTSGQEYLVTSVRKPLDGRVIHHQRCLLRRMDGGSSAN